MFAKHRKAYGVHSPFLYEFISDVLYSDSYYYAFDEIYDLRADLLSSNEVINVTDFGAGSKIMKTSERKIRDIAKYCGISEKFGEMLYRLVMKYKPKTILELGTSLGLGSTYLAKAGKNSFITTFEGCSETAAVAKENFSKLKLSNIHQIIADIDEKLSEYLSEINTLDFVYFDGNHQKNATLKYFNLCKKKAVNESIFYFDDIHWSKGMEEAWAQIKEDEDVRLSVDLFFSGLVFFKKELSKQDFVVKY